MPWDERVKEAAYTSPGGTRIVFAYEDVSRNVAKKTAAFEFPDGNGTYIQDLGRSGRRYPLRIFFWGPEYDLEADAFEALLLETGVGTLEHPIYGTKSVVPFGEIRRRDALKTSANQCIIEVTFFETTGVAYPVSQVEPEAEVISALAAYAEAAAEEFDDTTDLDSSLEQATFQTEYEALLGQAEAELQGIADTQGDVSRQFQNIVDSINAGIDILVADPITLARQTILMIQAPARAAASIQARLEAYANLATSLTSGDGSVLTPGYDSRNSNTFHGRDLYALAYVSGSTVACINHEFDLKKDAIEAAESVLAQFDTVVTWRDNNYESLAEIDTGGAYQQVRTVTSLLAGYLVQLSFTLRAEKKITVDRDRSMIDLVAEVYGDVDSQLDFFIASNDLSGSEILEIPKGREIVYYI